MAKILIVHDNDDQRKKIRKAALRAGFSEAEIVEARDESSAYQAISDDQYDIGVIDISLSPEPSSREGLGLIEELRKRQSGCRIVGLTSLLEEDGPAVYDHGGDDFIYTEWASIDYLELLRRKLADWRKARPRTFVLG